MNTEAVDVSRGRDLRARITRAGAPVAAFLLVGALVVVGSRAAFSATTDDTANAWSAGTVVLADDDSASAMFNATNMRPGATSQKCITVTYSGTLSPADIKLYGTVAGTGLAANLTTTIEIGAGGSFASCTGFAAGSTLYTGTLANFGSTYTNWASGLANWTTSSTPQSKTLRFTTTLDAAAPNTAQGKTASATFTWEAQNQ
jgi:Camelysin metallo-endopeptidase